MWCGFFYGGPPVIFLEPAEQVARVLYEQGSNYDYSIPKIPKTAMKIMLDDVDYVL